MGGRTGGMAIAFGPSAWRRALGLGDDGTRGNDRSGQDRGESDEVGRWSDWYVGIDLSWFLMKAARLAE
jgi:hypothetical protein